MLDFLLHFYNSNRHYLSVSINSVRRQTFRDWNLYLRDDGSDLELGKFVREKFLHDPRIHYARNKVNLGVPKTFNLNFASGSGKYVSATSDDNTYDPTFAEELVAFAESGNYDVATSLERWIDPKGIVTKERHDPRKTDHCLGQHKYKVKYLGGNGASSIWRRDLCERAIQVYGELCDPGLPGIEDYDMFCKFKELGAKFGFLEKVLYSYRLGTSSFRAKEVTASRLKFAEKWKLKREG